jgi:4-hydroxy-tetrahydrodipicolinate reductase
VGVNPGFVMDALPVLVSRADTEVEAVHVSRLVNVTERRIPLQKKMGLGMEPAAVQKLLDENAIGHVGLKASVQMLAAGLGWQLDVIDVDSHPIVAEEPTETGLGLIPVGGCIGISQQATGFAQLTPRITLKLDMQAQLPGGSRDEIFIDGKQSLHVRIDGLHGDHATAALVLNQAMRVAAMPAGLQTMLSAPLAA